MKNCFDRLCTKIYCGVQSFVHSERGAVDIVAIVVLIGIAIALAAVFSSQINSLITSIMEGWEEAADGAISNAGAGG